MAIENRSFKHVFSTPTHFFMSGTWKYKVNTIDMCSNHKQNL